MWPLPSAVVAALAAALMLGAGGGVAQEVEPPPGGADYWTVPGFAEHPALGPEQAKGVVFWSHGVAGRRAQYQYPPPAAVKRLAASGWDVVKINRNPLYETEWLNAGLKHVRDLARRAEEAKARGYRAVLAAGQSYGGAISLEASARSDAIDGVLALSPGQGSDATQVGNTRQFENLTRELIDSVERSRSSKIVLVVAEGDPLHPFEERGPKVRFALQAKASFVLFDEALPIKGHGAGMTDQFDAWYGDCLQRYFETAGTTGETTCPSPARLPRFLVPEDRRVEPAAPGTAAEIAALAGAWLGNFMKDGTPLPADDFQQLGLIVESVTPQELGVIYMLGSGPEATASMTTKRYKVAWEGERYFYKSDTDKFTLAVWPVREGTFKLVITGYLSGRTFEFRMSPDPEM